MKVVVIDPRLSGTASKADEWLPIRPGKDVLLLLGLARLLIEQGSIDEEFLRQTTNATALVADDKSLLRDKDGQLLVWDELSGSARPFATGVQPALRGSYLIDDKTYVTVLQHFMDRLEQLTPAYVAESTGIPEKKCAGWPGSWPGRPKSAPRWSWMAVDCVTARLPFIPTGD